VSEKLRSFVISLEIVRANLIKLKMNEAGTRMLIIEFSKEWQMLFNVGNAK